jgi:hypothetical protein
MKKKYGLLVILLSLFLICPLTVYAAPILGGGWSIDQVNAVNTNSVGSPYAFSLPASVYFRITDELVVGDVYKVYEGASLILTTTFFSNPTGFGDDPTADAAWMSSSYSHGVIVLAPGLHNLSVQGNGVGGLPAHFFTRLDAVPEPASMLLFCLGLVGLAGYSTRRKE